MAKLSLPQAQRLLISAVLNSSELPDPAPVPTSLDGVAQEWQWILDRHSSTGSVPSARDFSLHWPKIDLDPDVADPDLYVAQVDELAMEWRTRLAVEQLRETILTQGIEAALPQAIRDLASIQGTSRRTSFTPVFDRTHRRGVVRDVRQTQAAAASGVSMGVPTGLTVIDDSLDGLHPGWTAIVAARPGSGKTMFLVRAALAAAARGRKVLFWSLEMGISVQRRMFSMALADAGLPTVDPSQLLTGRGLDVASFEKGMRNIVLAGDILVCSEIHGAVTPAHIAAGIREHRPDLVIVDYLQLLKPADTTGSTGAAWQRIATISKELKQTAEASKSIDSGYRGCAVLTASQERRPQGSRAAKEPGDLTDLSGSDELGHDADIVVNAARQSRRILVCRWTKSRHGGNEGAVWHMMLDLTQGLFTEVDEMTAGTVKEEDRTELANHYGPYLQHAQAPVVGP